MIKVWFIQKKVLTLCINSNLKAYKMQILITKQNVDFFKELTTAKLKIIDSTANTCFISCSQKIFEELRGQLRSRGLNPYTYMAW